MEKRKRALVLTPFYPPNIGGVETFCQELTTELAKHYMVFVITINWGKQKIWKGLPFTESLKIFPLLFFGSLPYRSDIIYAQGFNAGVIGILLKKLWKCKLTITTHAIYNFKGVLAKVARWILNQADIVFTEGIRCEQDLKHIGVKNIVKYMHWVDQDRFKPFNKEHNDKEITVLFAGRPIKEKGIHIIKEVEKKFKNTLKKVNFIYATNIPSENMPTYYNQADILVVPSLYEESFARVVLEGASCGCVVISSNKGSLPELVKPFGYVIDPTVKNFYKVICHLADKKRKLKNRRRVIIKYARQNFGRKNAEVFI